MGLAFAVMQSGGPGSGCHGDNCGRKPTGKVYVSPNIKEGTHIAYALKALRSAKQKAFQSQALKIAKTITKDDPKVHGAIGVWADGAENSTEIQLHADKDTQAYVSALLGKAANQKAVLNWIPKADGPHALYTIEAKENPNSLHAKLASAGIQFHTIVPSKSGATAIILDQDASLGHAISNLSQENGYETTRRRGTGSFIGSWDTREAGKAAYNKIISSYESKHGGDFARHFGLAAGTIPARTSKDTGGRTKTEDKAYQEILDNDEPNPKPEDFEGKRGRVGRLSKPSKIAKRLANLKARRPDLVEKGFFAGGPGSGRHKEITDQIAKMKPGQRIKIGSSYVFHMPFPNHENPVLRKTGVLKYHVSPKATGYAGNGSKTPKGAADVVVSYHKLMRLSLDAAFNPDEQRDKDGKWTNGPANEWDRKSAFERRARVNVPSDLGLPKAVKEPVVKVSPKAVAITTPDEHALNNNSVDGIKVLGDNDPDSNMPNSAASYKIRFADDSYGVFKPASGECQDCRENIATGLQTEREVGAYQVAKIVGMTDMVAPTVAREVAAKDNKLERGSLQQWQEGTVAFLVPQEFRYGSDRDLARAAVFDYVVGNTDRNPGNWLVSEGYDKLHLIDHGLIFPETPTQPYPLVGDDMRLGFRRAGHELLMDAADRRGLDVTARLIEPYQKGKAAITKAMRTLGFSAGAINGVRQRITNLSLVEQGTYEPFKKLRELDQDADYGSSDGLRRSAIAFAVPVAGVIRIYKTVGMDQVAIGSLLLNNSKIVAMGAIANELLKEIVIDKYGVYSAQHNPAQWLAGLPSMSNGYIQFEKVGAIHAGGPGSGRHKEFLTPRLKKPRLKHNLSLKARIALANYVPAALKEHHLAEIGENMVRDAIKGKVTGKDSEPFDVLSADNKHAIEVKTLMLQHNDKITMRGSALNRKYDWANKNHASIHTVVLDMRNGVQTPAAVYYRHGVGSYRIGNMTKLPNGLSDIQKAIKGKVNGL